MTLKGILGRAPVSIPRRPPPAPRASAPAIAKVRPVPLRRKVMLIVLFAEIALVGLIVGMRLRGAVSDWGGTNQAVLPKGWIGHSIKTEWHKSITVVMELAAALGAFLVARYWSVKTDLAPARPSPVARFAKWLTGQKTTQKHRALATMPLREPFEGWGRGMGAALLVWLSPALLMNWAGGGVESWLAPVFVFAIFAALADAWFIAGLLMGVASAFNHQLLVIAPFFLLWPFCANAPRAMLRCLIGFGFAIALAVSPKLATTHAAWLWVIGVAMTPILLKRAWAGKGPFAAPWIGGPVTMQLVCWPLFLPQNRAWMPAAALAMFGLILIWLCRRMSARWFAYQVALAGAAALFVSPLVFEGSYVWVVDPLHAWAASDAWNLRAVLHARLGIDYSKVIFTIDLPAFRLHHDVTVGRAAIAVYGIALLLAAAITSWQADRSRAGAVVGATLPLLLAASLTGLSTPTALMLAGIASAIWLCAGAGMTIAHLALAAIAAVVIGSVHGLPQVSRVVAATRDAWPWVILLCTGIAAYGAILSGGRRADRVA